MTTTDNTIQINQSLADKILSCRENPADFARVFFNVEPTEQQQQFFSSISKPGAKVSIRSGHGTGKSSSLAMAALWFLTTRKNSLVPCTAPSAHQLSDVLWREIQALIGKMPESIRGLYRVTQDRVTLEGNPGAMIVGRTARKEAPDALQGFHSPEILFIVDEAAGVADTVFEVARGALSTPDARVAIAGNPTKITGYFHASHNVNRDAWDCLAFSCLDSPLVDSSFAEDMAYEYGDDSDIYRVRVLGEFPVHGMNSMVSRERVELSLDRKISLDSVSYAPIIIGVDPAWLGLDRSVIVMRQGIFAQVLEVMRGFDSVELATRVISLVRKLDADAVAIDVTGVGAGCYDHIKHHSGIRPNPVVFASKPSKPEQFINKRAEIWWRMGEWFDSDVCLKRGKWDKDIVTDISGPEYGMTDQGKIYLESKDDMRKRGLASPDIGDALAITFVDSVVHRMPGALAGAGVGTTRNNYSGSNNPRALRSRR